MSTTVLFPLQSTTKAELQSLNQTLWGWKPCFACSTGVEKCNTADCPWPRLQRFSSFHKFYKIMTCHYMPFTPHGTEPALRKHEDLLDIIATLKKWPNASRSILMTKCFGSRCVDLEDQTRAFMIAARILTMLTISDVDGPHSVVELGHTGIEWKENVSISHLLSTAFTPSNPISCGMTSARNRESILKTRLSAEAITQVGRLRLIPTDYINNHLELDTMRGTLQIFHHTLVLKEHLKVEAHCGSPGMLDGETEGHMTMIPRQIALEVLNSLFTVLFPPMTKSYSILHSFVRSHSLDEDILQLEPCQYVRSTEAHGQLSYQYFAVRLQQLCEEIENPTPRSRLDKWIGQRIAQRHFMIATLAGLASAIVLGILGLAVALVQAWLTYQAWKHPAAG